MATSISANKWMVIVNPNAGNGKGSKDWGIISGLLKSFDLDFEFCFTERRHHAIELTFEAVKSGYRKFIGVGGDGTMNEIVNGIFEQSLVSTNEMTIAMIPVGTGNDWGRLFGIPGDYRSAVEIIRRGTTTLHDAGLLWYYHGTLREKRYFINIAGLGFDALVVKRTNIQKDRGRVTKMAYMWNLLRSLISYRYTSTEACIDGEKVINDTFTISLGIGKYSGGGMMQTPHAVYNDGLFDVTIIKRMRKGEIIRNLKRLYNGTVYDHPKILWYRGSKIKIDSDPLIHVEADGESLGHSPIDFEIIQKSVNVVINSDPEEKQ